MKFVLFLIAGLLSSAIVVLAQARPIAAPSASHSSDVLGPAGFDAGDYVYVSGQGPRRLDGSTPPKFIDQVRQSLDNVKTVVEASGLTMDHVVYIQVHLKDVAQYPELNEVFASYFPKDPPARAVLGVAGLPESPVQITAVAVRELKGKQPVSAPGFPVNKAFSPGMLTHDRLFVSTMPGSDLSNGKIPQDLGPQIDLALDHMNSVLQSAGLTMANMVFVNPYMTLKVPYRLMNEHYAPRFEFGNTPARATIEVSSLPEGVNIAFTGVAVRDLNRRRAIRPKNMAPSPTASPCVFAGDTLFCSAKSGFIPGPNGGIFMAATADQTRQTMRNLLDNLEEADMNFDQVVSTTIYLDDLSEVPLFENVYKKYFNGTLPSSTTVQQLPPGDRKLSEDGHYSTLEQVSLIAIRNKPTIQ